MADPQNAADSIAGIKYATLMAGFLGSVISLSYTKELTRFQMGCGVMSGTIVAVYAAPLALHYINVPDTLERAIAFFTGLAAMRGVPALLNLVDRLKDLKLPAIPDREEK